MAIDEFRDKVPKGDRRTKKTLERAQWLPDNPLMIFDAVVDLSCQLDSKASYMSENKHEFIMKVRPTRS